MKRKVSTIVDIKDDEKLQYNDSEMQDFIMFLALITLECHYFIPNMIETSYEKIFFVFLLALRVLFDFCLCVTLFSFIGS